MRWLQKAIHAVRSMDPLLLLVRWSLVVLLVNANNDPAVFVALAVAAVIALPRPSLLLSPWFWVAAFVVVGARQLATWHTIDDHIIVTTYWCLALALGLTARDVLPTLAASARLLVGVVFLLAATWKVGAGQFVDGTFFRYSLLFDDRFEAVARWVGGTSASDLGANLDGLNGLRAQSSVGPSVSLAEGPRNVAVAALLTGWGVFIEWVVAITFLAPIRARHEWIRAAALFAFAATTYVLVPIGGFGTLLMLLGAAQTTREDLRMAYLGAGVALLVWAVVWPVLFL